MAPSQTIPDALLSAPETSPSGASYCWEQAISSIGQTSRPMEFASAPLATTEATPLGITLYAPPDLSETIEKGAWDSRHLVDGLRREMQIRAADVRQRRVPWLSWELPHALLDSADITELMYFVGRLFQLDANEDRFFSVNFRPEELSANRVALFKGLGFNSLEIHFPSDIEPSPGQLAELMETSDDFHFQHFGLNLKQPIESLPRCIAQYVGDGGRKPDRVTLRNLDRDKGPHQGENFSGRFPDFFQALRDQGYRVLGNDCFVLPNSPLAVAQNNHHLKLNAQGYNSQNVSDMVGIGPGSISCHRHGRSHNPVDLPEYLAFDFAGQAHGTAFHHQGKLVIDQLLCYHQLDLKYFEDRYHLQLEPLLRELWSPLQDHSCPPLFSIHQHQLTLSPEGILRLSHLCRELIVHFCD